MHQTKWKIHTKPPDKSQNKGTLFRVKKRKRDSHIEKWVRGEEGKLQGEAKEASYLKSTYVLVKVGYLVLQNRKSHTSFILRFDVLHFSILWFFVDLSLRNRKKNLPALNNTQIKV